MRGWRIDTLDSRAGIAFATWRFEMSFGSDEATDNAPCIFIGAPDFRPEPVSNKAIALGASRGAFQPGLFIGEVEVSFPTQAAVVEFVRRAYLRGGGGDVGGGGGEGPLPRPIEGPELPRPPSFEDEVAGGTGLRAQLIDAIAKFQKTGHGLELGNTNEFTTWPDAFDLSLPGTRPSLSAVGPAMLARAAVTLIFEMVARLPGAKDPRALVRWQRDARRLGDWLLALDLWPIVLSSPYYDSLVNLAASLVQSRRGLAALDEVRGMPKGMWRDIVLLLLFIDGPGLDEPGAAIWAAEAYYNRSPMHGVAVLTARAHPGRVDPLADLDRFPLPRELQTSIGEGVGDRASVYHALTSFIGSPGTDTAMRPALIDLVLFGAACIVGPDRGRPFSQALGLPWHRPAAAPLPSTRLAAVEAVAADAWNWVREHLPTHVFPDLLEKAIETTADLQYATAR